MRKGAAEQAGALRKRSLEEAAQRVTAAELNRWEDLLREYVHDNLSEQIEQPAEALHTLASADSESAAAMRASRKMDSCSVRAAMQALQPGARAPQTDATVVEIASLV